jgi:tRNA A37 threonylcarbamoyladenosine dehydratase
MTHSFSSEEERVFFQEAFSRNKGLLTEAEQERLRQSTVAVAGLGGVGGIEAVGLARLGVGHFHLSDPDTFEVANFNRQAGAMMSTVGKQKAEVIMAMIHDINPFAQVKVWNTALDETSVGPFLDGADIVVDGIDFFAQKREDFCIMRPVRRGCSWWVPDRLGSDQPCWFLIRRGWISIRISIFTTG